MLHSFLGLLVNLLYFIFASIAGEMMLTGLDHHLIGFKKSEYGQQYFPEVDAKARRTHRVIFACLFILDVILAKVSYNFFPHEYYNNFCIMPLAGFLAGLIAAYRDNFYKLDRHLSPKQFSNAVFDDEWSSEEEKKNVNEHLINCDICRDAIIEERKENPIYQMLNKGELK